MFDTFHQKVNLKKCFGNDVPIKQIYPVYFSVENRNNIELLQIKPTSWDLFRTYVLIPNIYGSDYIRLQDCGLIHVKLYLTTNVLNITK